MRFVFVFIFVLFAAPHVLAADISVDGAFVRATPAKISAGYMTIKNNGAQNDALVAVRAIWATRAELHNVTTGADGVLSMKQVARIDVPAGGTIKLAPGGYHVMFYGVNKPLRENTTDSITLVFQRAGDMTIPVAVKPITFTGK